MFLNCVWSKIFIYLFIILEHLAIPPVTHAGTYICHITISNTYKFIVNKNNTDPECIFSNIMRQLEVTQVRVNLVNT